MNKGQPNMNQTMSKSKPNATSTVARPKRTSKCSNNEDLEESLGILSIKTADLTDYSSAGLLSLPGSSSYLKEQRMLANSTLEKCSKVASIPSRLLKPRENTNLTESCFNFSIGSTVSESDLLKYPDEHGLSSTPRESFNNLSTSLAMPRPSIGESITKLSEIVKNSSIPFEKIMEKVGGEVKDILECSSNVSFKSASQVSEKLKEDENAWKYERHLPADKIEISSDDLNNSIASSFSVGEYFNQRCEDISNIIPRDLESSDSFDKPESTDTDKRHENSVETFEQCTFLSDSKIAELLSTTNMSPSKALDYLYAKCQKKTTISPASSENSLKMDIFNKSRESDKENVNLTNIREPTIDLKTPSPVSDNSQSSIRSASSLASLPNGKLPIESTHAELIWGCIKVGKLNSQQISLRNRLSKRVRLQCLVSGTAFKITQDGSNTEPSNIIKFVLHAHEVKSINVTFCPLTEGAAVEEINFTSLDPNLVQTKKQCIRLFGYGGYANIDFEHNVMKDSCGRYCLSLGSLNIACVIEKTFIVHNRGTLPAFGMLRFFPKEAFKFGVVKIVPDVFVVVPNQQKQITVSYHPQRDDVRYLQACVNLPILEIGILKFTTAAEVMRGRIRRLCRKISENKLELDSTSDKLRQKFPGEAIPMDVCYFKESVSSMRSLLREIRHSEILVSLEQDLDQTMIASLEDDSSLFESLCQDLSGTVLECTVPSTKTCKLEPSNIILSPPHKVNDFLLLVSESNTDLRFSVSVAEYLVVTPKQGIIRACETQMLVIKCVSPITEHKISSVIVTVENEVLQSEVKIIYIP